MTFAELQAAIEDMAHRCHPNDTVDVRVQVEAHGGCCRDDYTIDRRVNAESIDRGGRVVVIFARGEPLPRRGG